MNRLAVLALLLAAGAVGASSGPGTAGGPLAGQPMGARPLALGATYVALADDSLAALWNPAGLAHLPGPEVSLTYQRDPGEIMYGFLIFARPLPWGQCLSVAAGTLQTGDIDFHDLAGKPQSVAGESDWLGVVSYSLTLHPNLSPPRADGAAFSAGLSLKYLRSEMGEVAAGGSAAADLGVLAALPLLDGLHPTRLGAAWQNVGAAVNLGSGSDPVSSPLRVGLAQRLGQGRKAWTAISGEWVKVNSRDEPELHAGVEQVVQPGDAFGIAVRGGYRFGADLPGLSGGIGIKAGPVVLDFAAGQLGHLGLVQRAGLRIRW